MIKVSLVPLNHVHEVWEKVAGYLERAAAETNGRYTGADILGLIFDYEYPLWIAFDEDDIKGAVVTCIVDYPRKKYLYLMFCGGVDGMEWKDQMLKVLQHWAFDSGCDGIEATGRLGWQKIFKDDGLKPIWQQFELPIAASGLGN
jgi:hypothetical protein